MLKLTFFMKHPVRNLVNLGTVVKCRNQGDKYQVASLRFPSRSVWRHIVKTGGSQGGSFPREVLVLNAKIMGSHYGSRTQMQTNA